MAKPYDFKSLDDVDRLALENPDEFDRLLRGYKRLLGKPKLLWWEDDPSSIDENWPYLVRDAIVEMAERCGVSPRRLANWLDNHPLPHARACILERARAHL